MESVIESIPQTGDIYKVQFKNSEDGPVYMDNGVPLEVIYYDSELRIDPNGPNKYDQYNELVSNLAIDGFINPNEPFAVNLSIFSDIDSVVAISAIKSYQQWLSRHRELPLLGTYRSFFDWNHDHLDEMRSEFTNIKTQDDWNIIIALINLANYLGTFRLIHMLAKVISESFNGLSQSEIAKILGLKIELTPDQIDAVKQDIYEMRTTPSPQTGIIF